MNVLHEFRPINSSCFVVGDEMIQIVIQELILGLHEPFPRGLYGELLKWLQRYSEDQVLYKLWFGKEDKLYHMELEKLLLHKHCELKFNQYFQPLLENHMINLFTMTS